MSRFLATVAAAVVVVGQPPIAAAGIHPAAAEPGPVSVELDNPIAAGVPGTIVLLMGLVMVRGGRRRPVPVT
ncbi:MAG: hypothetical protein QOH50_4511, partial [Kribbellaceae bacterium]|nr:hypothetical protein [Kribbellaceae bacterium]